jgi:hypothetical protein
MIIAAFTTTSAADLTAYISFKRIFFSGIQMVLNKD